jgi:5-methylcytosine-specific restriction endonuclease McrA
MVLTYFPSGPLKPVNGVYNPKHEQSKKNSSAKRAWKKIRKFRFRRKRNNSYSFGSHKPATDRQEYYRKVYLKSDHWKKLRADKLGVNPCCEKCGSTKRIEPHHLRYKNLYDVEITDLQTLCRKCHTLEHKRLDWKNRNAKVRSLDKSEQGTSRRDQPAGEFRSNPGVEAEQRAVEPV